MSQDKQKSICLSLVLFVICEFPCVANAWGNWMLSCTFLKHLMEILLYKIWSTTLLFVENDNIDAPRDAKKTVYKWKAPTLVAYFLQRGLLSDCCLHSWWTYCQGFRNCDADSLLLQWCIVALISSSEIAFDLKSSGRWAVTVSFFLSPITLLLAVIILLA